MIEFHPWMFWIGLLVGAVAFNVFAHVRAWRGDRRRERLLLEVHGMLLTLVDKDSGARRAMVDIAINDK